MEQYLKTVRLFRDFRNAGQDPIFSEVSQVLPFLSS